MAHKALSRITPPEARTLLKFMQAHIPEPKKLNPAMTWEESHHMDRLFDKLRHVLSCRADQRQEDQEKAHQKATTLVNVSASTLPGSPGGGIPDTDTGISGTTPGKPTGSDGRTQINAPTPTTNHSNERSL